MIKKNKKRIEPQYLYNAQGKVTHVYLSAEDYKAFMKKLEKLAQEVKAIQSPKR